MAELRFGEYEKSLGKELPANSIREDNVERNDSETQPLSDVEVRGDANAVEMLNFKIVFEPEIKKHLAKLKGVRAEEISSELAREIILMAFRMHKEDENLRMEDLAQVAAQEYFEGNDGSKSWLLRGK
ncbi:MAG: hypothetical protein WCO05_00335 [Candidatus Moraniibacteriota bacterium]|jgi:SOS response regulatory protein OraA/RecX